MPRPKSNKEQAALRSIVHEHLRRGASLASSSKTGAHLDEDALSVFVEGRLSEMEAAPVIRHLVGCASCRNITAQLVRLDTELSTTESAATAPAPAEEPGRIGRLLAKLASRVLPSTNDDAVFAYHAPADDFEKKDEAKAGEEGSPEEAE